MILSIRQIALEILHAYEEGWGDYDSPANANTLFTDAWNNSLAKKCYDELMELENARTIDCT